MSLKHTFVAADVCVSKALNLRFANSPLVKSFWPYFALAVNRKTEGQSEKL